MALGAARRTRPALRRACRLRRPAPSSPPPPSPGTVRIALVVEWIDGAWRVDPGWICTVALWAHPVCLAACEADEYSGPDNRTAARPGAGYGYYAAAGLTKGASTLAGRTLGELLDRKDVLVIDTETTGLDRRSEVLEVAVIDTTGRVLLDTVSLPQGRIPRDASDVHGLTRARLRTMGARPWPAVHAELALLLEDASSVIAWNAEFDRNSDGTR